ncbi:MAG: hypothetical protein HC817_03755 [Saprospiraceae bacterium]|nr:hypothetical protein [Saprospiraceae bacterium]
MLNSKNLLPRVTDISLVGVPILRGRSFSPKVRCPKRLEPYKGTSFW